MNLKDFINNLKENLISIIPDTYTKNHNSNIGKLIGLFAEEVKEINQGKNEVYKSIDIEKAEGYFLNRIGENVGQKRGRLDDEKYRVAIKSRIQQNFSPGDINSLIEFISSILLVDGEDIEIIEPVWGTFQFSDEENESSFRGNFGFDKGALRATDPEPAKYEIRVPFESISDRLVEAKAFLDIMQKLTGAGIKVSLFTEGTFAFSNQFGESEYDSDFGFDEGKFGFYYDSEETIVIP